MCTVNNVFIADLTGLIPLKVRVSSETAKTGRWADKKRKERVREYAFLPYQFAVMGTYSFLVFCLYFPRKATSV